MKRLLIWLNIIIPVLINLFIPDLRYGWIPIIIVQLLALPIGLTILNIGIIFKKIEASPLKCFLFMFFGLMLGNLVGYAVWGVTSGIVCLFPKVDTKTGF